MSRRPSRLVVRRSHKIGLSPGTVLPPEREPAKPTRIHVLEYDESGFTERVAADVAALLPLREAPVITWVNVDGLGDTKVIEAFGAHFGVHPLVLEDIVSSGQRPKFEDYDGYLFLVFKMLTFDTASAQIHEEQVSVLLGERHVISFQEIAGDVFDPVRERIRQAKGRVRRMGADYLAYALLDSVVDHYFVVLERLGDRLEELENELISDPGPEVVGAIHRIKRELLLLRRSVWPLREVISGLQRCESPLVSRPVHVFLRDVYDHTVQVIETGETFRDMVAGMLDTYLTTVSNRMNEVMKVLTIIATLFIPLTFVAGVYGMNFERMPELGWPWGYPAALALMAVMAAGMIAFFRRRGWL